MLGRHVYRVRPQISGGGWIVQKDGETSERGDRANRAEAVAWANDLAAADEPSRLVVEDPHGAISEERVFGIDAADTIDDPSPLARKPEGSR